MVSVIIPCFKSNSTIEDTIRSVVEQTYQDWEIIIVDNGLTLDRTLPILNNKAYKKRINIVPSETNLGAALARNLGAENANGKYIAFLDSDDIWNRDKLHKEMKVMETFKVADMSPAIVFTGRSLIDEKGKDVGVYIGCKKVVTYKKLLHTNQINCSSVLIEKDLFLKYPMKDGKLHEDYACWLEILRDNRYAAGINMPLLYYRVRPGSKSGNKFNSAILNYNTYKRIGLKFTERLFYMMTYTMNGLLKYRKR